MRNSIRFAVGILALVAAGSASAIYQCRDASGKLAFQAQPCQANQKQEKVMDEPKQKSASCDDCMSRLNQKTFQEYERERSGGI